MSEGFIARYASGRARVTIHRFPSLPYDEVQSAFIREQIRTGQFEELAHRTYVNNLVYVEWYATDGLSPTATGLSRAGAIYSNWRIAAKYPEAYDTVRQELGAETRSEYQIGSRADNNPELRQQWARRHRNEWRSVREDGDQEEQSEVASVPIDDRPSFAAFRFPQLPYDELRSEFVVDELQGGCFNDLEHRRYVNQLVYIEAWTREPSRLSPSGYPPTRPWVVAAKLPEAYDIIRAELGATTRRELVPHSGPTYSDAELRTRRAQHKQEWQRVQESKSPR